MIVVLNVLLVIFGVLNGICLLGNLLRKSWWSAVISTVGLLCCVFSLFR